MYRVVCTVILPGSEAAAELSKTDMARRLKVPMYYECHHTVLYLLGGCGLGVSYLNQDIGNSTHVPL